MRRETKGWSKERRSRQAENIRKTKPWKRATGAKTVEGKQVVSRNAYRHGFRSEDMKVIRRLLRAQRNFVKKIQSVQCEPCHACLTPINLSDE